MFLQARGWCLKKLTLILTLWPLFMDGVQLSQGWSHLAVKNSMAP